APGVIILDPPRDGVHPKALPKILAFGARNIVYVSCKPTSLARDLPVMIEAGYRPVRGVCVDMFPGTGNVETVCCLYRQKEDLISVPYEPGNLCTGRDE
ncbi:MAG: 23S rRNA (uracil-5-)-methyltransferase RumA, partial [Lachnospiraceae bacterium]|nr:23S rRNA (uracil-5-)-methyltransferase RumA [Lachnospiraceae bacterium]